MKPLVTHEIGSLAKPNWRVKLLTGRPLTDTDIEDAKYWATQLGLKFEGDELLSILHKRKGISDQDKQRVIHISSLFATKLLERAGLDLVFDGEQHRIEMYEHVIRNVEGFKFYGHVRSFDNKYYRRAACVYRPSLKRYYHLDEFNTVKGFTSKPIKVPVTGAYTVVDWSFDEYYMKNVAIGTRTAHEARHVARVRFLKDVAERIVKPNLKSLIDAGAKYIQLDEPAATTKRDEVGNFIDTVIWTIGELKHTDVFWSIHICFSNYSTLFPHIEKLQGIVHELHFEYANRDTKQLGRHPDVRIGYDVINQLKGYNFVVGIGTIDVHTDYVEPPELVRDRILYVVDIIGDPYRVFVAPDCGLRTRSWHIAYQKLRNMVEGRNLAARELGLTV